MYYSIFLIFSFILFYSPALAQSNQDGTAPAIENNSGDAEKGKVVFYRCQACHNISLTQTEVKPGPNLFGILGKKAASDENYGNYSKALKEADFIWDEEGLETWFKNPNAFLPGNTMAFSGVMRQVDRDDLIAYIRALKKSD
jgi:cytochrome c